MMRTPEKSNSFPDLTVQDVSKKPIHIGTRNKRRRSPTESTSDLIQNMASDIKNEMKCQIKELIESQNSQINKILETVKDIQQTSNSVQTTLAYLLEENSELKAKIEKLENQRKQDKEQITLLENKIEENQRIERKANIEIRNVPLSGKEKKTDLLQMVHTLSDCLKLKMDKTEIKDIIRTKKQKQERSTLIVEFTNTFIKDDLLRTAKSYNYKNKSNKLSAKQLGISTNQDIPIFISENLTPHCSRLYFLARDFKQSNNFKYCWTNYGKVYLRRDDDSPIITIHKEIQLQDLLKK